ncbi:MAG: hypothetical protein M4579_003027 [Chaenotheca gracillima]|nr:MAG: hypothetical protein M4579_003027 [Chaenotheca gracillima]
MNGSASDQPSGNQPRGEESKGPSEEADYVSHIRRALGAVFESGTTNETRKEASVFLEQVKSNREAPYYGFSLASQKSQPPHVRHYGLSLLEHAIKRNWTDYSPEQSLALREWIISLAQGVDEADPLFIRNKVAQLWVELAKRSWAADWMNMDELLVTLWSGNLVQKELVATVLEELSEDIFVREDPVSILRDGELSKACVEIFTPANVLQEHFPSREKTLHVRQGEEGWFQRLGEALEFCSSNSAKLDDHLGIFTKRVLSALKVSVGWAIPRALVEARIVERVCSILNTPNVFLQLASIDVLHTLYGRSGFEDAEFVDLVCPMFTLEAIGLLRKIYQWSFVNANDIDEEKYSLSKKFSEMLSLLASCREGRPNLLRAEHDLSEYLNLLVLVMSNDSLVVSIPILSVWARLLKADLSGKSQAASPLIGPVLELCSHRLIRYENLPDDSDDPTYIFLNEDFDTIPERHAFLGNYRRYCVEIVEAIVQGRSLDAMTHILGQADGLLQEVFHNQGPLQAANYSKNSPSYLRVDARVSVVEGGIRGYRTDINSHSARSEDEQSERNKVEASLEDWCRRILDMNFEDPAIRKRILQVAVMASTSVLEKRADFMLFVLKHILMTRSVDHPSYPAYSEAVKELHNDCTSELSRLAAKMPNLLMNVYDDLEAKINDMMVNSSLDERQKLAYSSFLFTITHRATTIDPVLREQRLRSFTEPVIRSWQNEELERSLSSFTGFCQLAGVSKVEQFVTSRNVLSLKDWSTCHLDEEGRAIQTEMNACFPRLPLKPTKVYMGASLEKVKKGSHQYPVAVSLWQSSIPIILPNLLRFLRFAHAFHNPEYWTGLPVEMQPVVGRLLTDRFWQAGISTGSKDEFYARVGGTKATLEGFASSVRSAIRSIRETCYSTIYCMTKLDVHFYGFTELAEPLAQALFSDTKSLSSHQLSIMMNMVRYLVDDCPPALRHQFLPPILSSLFTELDAKINGEWAKLDERSQNAGEDDNLTNEMKEESILRQLTYTCVLMVASLLDPARTDAQDSDRSHHHGDSSHKTTSHQNNNTKSNTMRAFVLSSLSVLRPLMLFSTHALQWRDSRCCGIIIRVFRSIVPEFTSAEDPTASAIREYICSDILKAAITSLNDPYFVDLQKDIAQFIAIIYTLYNVPPLSNTPHTILLSLPGITEDKLNRTAEKMFAAKNQKQLRALVLNLLEGVRGVSISEQGRIIPREAPKKTAKDRSAMQMQFMSVDDDPGQRRREPSPDLGGVADMFG